ncbi:restriction endonuclease subunit S [Leucothrix arctica]|uniref:Restriction endonuclease subunit S n=1 Tax=Leucothrix arctica TaxID=1481894 RepID=A0A317CAU1_9GAMM|nr:restriction endonuclease subunit S [Leucothrix arctica]PWQ93202.1 restriction endonuclease subunit S [Leucothrix arctica]
MGNEWTLSTLGDLAEIEMGQSPKGDACNSDAVGTPLLNGPTEFGTRHPYPTQFTTDPKRFAKEDDILFCVRGSTTGRMNWADKEYAIGRGLAAFRHKKGSEYKSFLRGIIDSKVPELLSSATGSTFPNVSKAQLHELEILVPPLQEQKAIAHILGSLDDKIELNRQMNETLEAMAQALFKSWFVDFDPVIDNALAAGNAIPDVFAERAEKRKAVKKDEVVNPLFPDAFEYTEEMGWIPQGWETSNLADLTTELRRGISPKYTEEDGVKVVNQRCIREHKINFSVCRKNDISLRKVDGRFLEVGDLLINSTGVGTLGRMAQVTFLDEPTVVDSHVTVVRPNPEKYKPYSFAQMMISIEPHVESMGLGSTGQTELSRSDLSELITIVPNTKLQQFVEYIFISNTEKIVFNSKQSISLTKLRDTLLPKLLSGELRIPDAEKLVEQATR